MSEFSNDKRVVIAPDAATLATQVAERFLERVATRVARGKVAHVALTGGTIGTEVLKAAGASPKRAEIDWSRVHFWWGDERFTARAGADRNENGARRALLDHIEVPEANIHAMAASDDGLELEDAAQAYESELARFGKGDRPWPSFDVCFLGVGPDGHIASLFPDRHEIQVTDRAVLPVREAPKPPPTRITLTRPVINSAKRAWMVLAGPDKAAALGLALAGASYESVPAAGAKGRRRTILFVDEAAAANAPAELIVGDY